MFRKSIRAVRMEGKRARCAAMRAAKEARRLARDERRGPMTEVLRCVFSGPSVDGGPRIVTVEVGEPFEQAVMRIDGVAVAWKSWPRCRGAILRRVFKGMSGRDTRDQRDGSSHG